MPSIAIRRSSIAAFNLQLDLSVKAIGGGSEGLGRSAPPPQDAESRIAPSMQSGI